ncbi:RNA polymerase sigma factor [Aquimarina agarilytica]|uniref:RNA polymerase sigma factor n=1 Tax=Aquimarina agarilytica TaxID=1087449 RepID=UPI00058E1D41|nr:sigma-70 family RNA polymerase sigma factor [Aquimarina agarilytica]
MGINSEQLLSHIENAKQGMQASFSFLLDTFWNDVYQFQLRRTQNDFEAEEITIKSFSSAFDKIDSFNPEYSFRSWLLAISKNAHIDQIRKQKNKWQIATQAQENSMANTVLDHAPTPEDQLITKQNLAELLLHIKQLKPHYQEMIQLRYFQEMSYKEMTEELNEPMNNIKVKLLRAKKLLLTSLNAAKK